MRTDTAVAPASTPLVSLVFLVFCFVGASNISALKRSMKIIQQAAAGGTLEAIVGLHVILAITVNANLGCRPK